MKFNDAEQVAYHFGLPDWTHDQWMLIENYIQFGVIPDPDGCLGCDAAYIRTVIGRMEAEPEPEPKVDKPRRTQRKGAKSAGSDRVRSGADDGNLSDELPRGEGS